MKDFKQALYELCSKVEDFRQISRDIIIPERKRRERLKQYAQALHKATTDFLEVSCEHGQD